MLKNRILDKIDVVWREMKDLQPKNAKIAQNEDALKDTLTRYGFSVPFYGWKDKDGAIWVIDGHTRKKVLSTFGAVPEKLPCILIDAKSKKEAQEILIEVFNQKHNPFDVQVLEQFINENELKVNVENVNIEVGEVGLSDANELDYSDKNKEIDIDGLETTLTIKLQYCEDDYQKVKSALSKIAQSPEEAVFKLLGL